MSWMRPYKLAEYLAGDFQNLKAAERWIYFAVIRGDIRAQYQNGEIVGAPALKRIARGRWSADPDDVFGLPSDIGLSMDDGCGIGPGVFEALEARTALRDRRNDVEQIAG